MPVVKICETSDILRYIEIDIQTKGILGVNTGSCTLLVLQSTEYNRKVDTTKNKCPVRIVGVNFLQKATSHTPWYLAFRCLSIRQVELRQNKIKLAVIRSSELRDIIIPPNSTIRIEGITIIELDVHPTCVMTVHSKGSILPDDFEITPAVVYNAHGRNGLVTVQISNTTAQTPKQFCVY